MGYYNYALLNFLLYSIKSDKQNPYTMHNSNFITFSFWVYMFPFRSIISIWGISTYRLKTHPNQLGVLRWQN